MSERVKLTKAQRAWLEKLDHEGIASGRPHGAAAYNCMRAGWTEWACRLPTGEIIGHVPIVGNYEMLGERLTKRGRAALRSDGGKDA